MESYLLNLPDDLIDSIEEFLSFQMTCQLWRTCKKFSETRAFLHLKVLHFSCEFRKICADMIPHVQSHPHPSDAQDEIFHHRVLHICRHLKYIITEQFEHMDDAEKGLVNTEFGVSLFHKTILLRRAIRALNDPLAENNMEVLLSYFVDLGLLYGWALTIHGCPSQIC